MNEHTRESSTEGANNYQAREIVVDEDVLSLGARAAIEQVGSATGFVLAIALMCALLPRAGRFLSAHGAAGSVGRGEDRDVREVERRALDASERTGGGHV